MIGIEQRPWPEPIEGFVLDLDGTVYRGDEPIPSAIEAVQRIRTQGTPTVFMTNNATRSRDDFARKLTRMGLETQPADVVNTSFATARHLAQTYAPGTSVYVLGAQALSDDIAAAGFEISDADPQAVVVGLDREFTYAKLRAAVRAILGGADFIATNPDRLIPNGALLDPGAGTIVAAVEAATQAHAAPVFIGKPEAHMPRIALELLGSRPEATVAVGDQLFTDVAAGKNAGMFAVLVETGVPVQPDGAIVPDRTISSLLEMPVA